MDQNQKIYYGILAIAVILLVLQAIQIWQCYQDNCCSMDWLIWKKEAFACPGYGTIWRLPH